MAIRRKGPKRERKGYERVNRDFDMKVMLYEII